MLVTSSAPIDQFVARNPEFFFGASPEHALVNPDNLHILLDHVKCAAFELPFTSDETFGTMNVQDVLAVLAEEGFVHQVDGQWQWTQDSYPADAVSLRSVTSDNFVIVDVTDGERVIGETDFTSGPSTLHEKAIYIVEGTLFQVERLDFEGRKAFVRQVECDYYTDAITYTKVTILDTFASSGRVTDERVAAGRCDAARSIGTRVLARRECRARRGARRVARRRLQEDQVLHERERRVGRAGSARAADAHDVVLADDSAATSWRRCRTARPIVATASSAWRSPCATSRRCCSCATATTSGCRSMASASAARRGSAARRVLERRTELSAAPTIFLYDNYPGGIGFSEPLFGMHDALLARTHELIDGCPCESGCPSCVGPEGATGPLAKAVALAASCACSPPSSAAA